MNRLDKLIKQDQQIFKENLQRSKDRFFELNHKTLDAFNPVSNKIKFNEFRNKKFHYYHPIENTLNSIITEFLKTCTSKKAPWSIGSKISSPERKCNHLTYCDSQLTRFTKNYKSKFVSRYETDKFALDQQSEGLKSDEIIICVVRELMNLSQPPSITYFKKLLDYLHKKNLKIYQSIIIRNLVDLKYGVTDSNCTEFRPEFFKSIIEKDPSILGSLLNYFISNNDSETFKRLLIFDLSSIDMNQLLKSCEGLKNQDFASALKNHVHSK
ncbi:hypothetical protein CLIB1444_02S13432 [[Candida] jaroonii]|uniref:Uncharacterized protein n=1 Tax=[Candida] jaroonii TaxID=467808 RepID=A0ACA9Y3V3_9ASCO|nr:hypothetical protein CLIB1444_02S13432 [[Candida] jaroonii]